MHESVLYDELLHWLQPQPGGQYVDGTLGYGGHTYGILQRSAPDGRVLAFDRDQAAIAVAKERLGELAGRVTFVHDSFEHMQQHARAHHFDRVRGVALDLGLSSMQLDEAERGFSFRYDAPLDMRFDRRQPQTAATILNNATGEELADILWRYGEVRGSRRLARMLIAQRPIETTAQLADIVLRAMPARRGGRSRIHPATQVFQALRIAVNDELGALERGLTAARDLLQPGGRLVVISFHSLEDRLVKQTLRRWSQTCVCPPQQPVCTCNQQASVRLPKRKAIKPDEAEIDKNRRSRSARMRVAERC